MKIYQLIYTAVKHSLSDPELELINQAGYRVYSCTQGLTADEINEIIRFCGYRLPKNSEVKYSKTPFDPTIPDLFPKTFRTFKTDSGKYVAVQVVYSGYDWNGEEGNFFAHAFVIEDAPDGFRPEEFYDCTAFRKCLTESEINTELVRYMPLLEDYECKANLTDKIDNFVYNHKIQMSVILEQSMAVLAGTEKTHICISAKNQEESDMYVLGLKRILPPTLADRLGISTNNIFLPSAGQNKIVINGTISGKNNISDDDIDNRTNCVYIDTQRIQTDGVKPMKLFEMSMDELYESYERFSIQTGKQLQLWLNSYERINEQGVGDRMRTLYNSVGETLFCERTLSIYNKINQADFKQIRFEILEVMFEKIELFPNLKSTITTSLIMEGIECICAGEQRNVENVFRNISKEDAADIYKRIDYIMSLFNADSMDEKSGTLLLRIFSLLKFSNELLTWREFFKDDEKYITEFLELSAKVIINDTSPVTFTAPATWTENDTAEVIVLFDSSTDDAYIKKACRKYILENKNAVWSTYGITLHKNRKTSDDMEFDLQKVRKLLREVGYAPYQRTSYSDVKYNVINEMSTNENPLLLFRLLNAFYQWQGSETSVASEKNAVKVAELITEMRETQLSCYNYVFPKLALEILDCAGENHELIINSQTMDDNFWHWFYIGFKNNYNNENIRVNYERVAAANKTALSGKTFYRKIFK